MVYEKHIIWTEIDKNMK